MIIVRLKLSSDVTYEDITLDFTVGEWEKSVPTEQTVEAVARRTEAMLAVLMTAGEKGKHE